MAAAKAMCKLAHVKMLKAQLDMANNIPHEEQHYYEVADYAQNLGIPHIGSEQPGDTYYSSPKTIYEFSIANVTQQPTQLNAYVYEEETGVKGGNNVASLLVHDLQKKGWIKEGNSLKSLTIILDNCGGQNKNKYAL